MSVEFAAKWLPQFRGDAPLVLAAGDYNTCPVKFDPENYPHLVKHFTSADLSYDLFPGPKGSVTPIEAKRAPVHLKVLAVL
jgi:hypothetical protein